MGAWCQVALRLFAAGKFGYSQVMEPNSEPLIWALQTKRAGDNAQALELARLVGGRIEIKALSFNWRHFLPNLLLGASDASLVDHGLAPPWPDLVIAVGKRTSPISRWIKAQSEGESQNRSSWAPARSAGLV